MKNAINWFEIPAKDYERAKKFYSEILQLGITDHHMPEKNMKYGVFPYDIENNAVGGAIVEMEGLIPSIEGSTVYLNGGDNLNNALSKVVDAGGEVVMQKTEIGKDGFIAQFIDTEGNRVALHSIN